MSFYVNLYTFTKEPNSTAQPTGTGTQHQCVSNTPFDVLHPNIPLNLGNAANPTAYNYCKIPDFQNRYYWIRTWTWEDGLWVAHCDVDPLASWKTAIGSTSAYVLRAAADYDGNVIDNLYPRATNIGTDFQASSKIWSTDPFEDGEGCYIVGINGNGAVVYVNMAPSQFNAFFQALFSDEYYTDALGFYAAVNQSLTSQIQPLQYIASIVWIPVDIARTVTISGGLKVGTVNMGTLPTYAFNYYYADLISTTPRSVSTTVTISHQFTPARHPESAARGYWVNTGLSEYELSVPPFGSFQLDPATVSAATTIDIYITIDKHTGQAVLKVFASIAGEDPLLMVTAAGQVGVPIAVSHVMTPGADLSSSVIPSFQALGSLFSLAGSALSSNPAGMIGSATSILSAGFSALGDLAQTKIPHTSTSGGQGSHAGLASTFSLQATWYNTVNEDNTHRGRPLCQVRQLSTLSGYQLCTNVDVQAAATREELDAIRTYLESGYYYE